MREPLIPMIAYETDVKDGARWSGHPTQPHGWFSVTHIAHRVATLPADRRLYFVETLPRNVLPDPDRRPTQINLDSPREMHPLAIAAERFRVAAEEMERDLCFEMAYTTVSAAARIVARIDAAGAMSASNHLARILRQLGETAAAEELYQSVADEAIQRGFPSVAGYALGGLGNLAIMRGNRPAQLQYFTRALVLAPLDSRLESVARWGLMNHALAINSLADALVHGWRAYDLAETNDERAGILHNLSSVALRARFIDEAIAGLESALRLAPTARIWLAVAATAAEAAGLGGRERLLMTLEEEGHRRSGHTLPFENGQWLLGLAQGWAATGSTDAAEKFASDALALAQKHDFHELAYRAEELLQHSRSKPSRSTTRDTSVPAADSLTEMTRNGLARLYSVAV